MRYPYVLIPLCATVALSACGEDQTAKAPAAPAPVTTTAPPAAPPAAAMAERPAAPPVTTTTAAPPAATAAPPAATTSAALPVGTTGTAITAAPAANPAGSTGTGRTGSATTAGNTTAPVAPAPEPNPAGSQSAAAAPANLQSFQGRSYSAGPISVHLNADNTFEMNQTNGNQKVTGRYTYENGVLRLSDPQGDVGGAQFPMNCRFEIVGTNEFRLTENDASCTRFKDLTFKPAAG